MKIGIYQIVNKITEHRYIGLSININQRFNQHRYYLRSNKHKNPYLQNAWNKYGENNFSFEILQECNKEDLCFYEDYWVKTLKVYDKYYGYNLLLTNPNGKHGHSEETKLKFKNNMKGKVFPVSAIEKAREINKKKMTPEYLKMLKDSRSHLNWKSIHREKCGRRIINTETGEIYNSLVGLAELINANKATLGKRLNGKLKNLTPYKYI